MGERVVITGMGAVTPIGNDVPAFWSALVEGRSGAGPLTAFDPDGLEVRIAAEVKGLDASAHLGRREVRRTDRFTQLALISADEAIADAGLDFQNSGDNRHAGIIIGTGIGGITTLLDNMEVMRQRGPRRVSALMVPMMMPNAAAGQIAIRYGIRGMATALSAACATGANAIGEGLERIRHGVYGDHAIVLRALQVEVWLRHIESHAAASSASPDLDTAPPERFTCARARSRPGA